MGSNFWQDKWLHDQYNRTEEKERERVARMEREKAGSAKSEPATKPAPDTNQVAASIVATATGETPPKSPKKLKPRLRAVKKSPR